MDGPIPLTVLGTVALDTIETPTACRERILGGSATYFAAAARLLAPVQLLSAVGEDFDIGAETTLRALGVDPASLTRLPGCTYAWHGRYEDDFANATTVAREVGVVDSYEPPAGGGQAGGGLFLGAFAPALQRRVLDSSPATALTALDSRESWIGEAPAELLELAARVDFVFLNRFELAALTGRASVEDGVRALHDRGAGCVIVKRGADGATLHTPLQTLAVPAYATDVVDPTGAGDAFAGGFIGTLANCRGREPEDLGEGLRRGAALASFALESIGIDALAKLSREELEQRADAVKWSAPN